MPQVPNTARSSPDWHRHRRTRRHRARRRIQAARAANCQPRLADILLLEAHHSRPNYRELAILRSTPRMGGKRDQQQQWRGYDAGDGGRYQSWSSQAPWRPKAKAQPQIPTYSSIVVKQQNPQRSESLVSADGHPDDLNQLQAAINAARKAEQKVTRIQKQQALAQEQWEIFAQSLKDGWIRERERFMRDGERLSADLAAAMEGQQRARLAVHAVYAGHPLQGEPTAPEEVQEVEDAGWDSMVGGWEREQRDGSQEVLRRALESAQAIRTPVRSHIPSRTPPPAERGGAPIGSPNFGSRSPPGLPVASDPYTFTGTPGPTAEGQDGSGTMPTMESTPPPPRSSPIHPGQRDLGQIRVPTTVAAPRPGIKDATKTQPAADTGGCSLSTKLDAKRNAMKPLGGPAAREPQAPRPHPAPPHHADLSAIAKIVNDDSDDDLMQDGVPDLS